MKKIRIKIIAIIIILAVAFLAGFKNYINFGESEIAFFTYGRKGFFKVEERKIGFFITTSELTDTENIPAVIHEKENYRQNTVSFGDLEGEYLFFPIYGDPNDNGCWGSSYYSEGILPDENNTHPLINLYGDLRHASSIHQAASARFTIHINRANRKATQYFYCIYQNKNNEFYLKPELVYTLEKPNDNTCYSTDVEGNYLQELLSMHISIKTSTPPSLVAICEFNENNELIKRTEYNPVEIPDTLKIDSNVEFIVVESHGLSEKNIKKITHTLYDHGADGIEIYKGDSEYYVHKKYVVLKWM